VPPDGIVIAKKEVAPSSAFLIAAVPSSDLVYENRFRNHPISGGRELSCRGAERLPELHSPAPSGGIAGQFMGALYVSHYLWVIFAFQVIAGALLLVNRYVPLAVAVLAPVRRSLRSPFRSAPLHWRHVYLCQYT
jgi:hypothetical protein